MLGGRLPHCILASLSLLSDSLRSSIVMGRTASWYSESESDSGLDEVWGQYGFLKIQCVHSTQVGI